MGEGRLAPGQSIVPCEDRSLLPKSELFASDFWGRTWGSG